MNKSELISILTSRIAQDPDRIEAAVHFIFESMKEELAKGNSIEIEGFGDFVPKVLPEHDGHDPRNGKAIRVPLRWQLRFLPCLSFRITLHLSRAVSPVNSSA